MQKILIIEDDVAICQNIVEILELEDFEAFAANDGQTGVDLALKHLPDLILCDIMMPVMNGYQVLLTLRDHAATAMIPFLFLTAKADHASVRYGMEMGADDYLTKPFSAPSLVSAIRVRLEKQRALAAQYATVLDDLRGNIIHMLPHELRTPLVSILGYSELLMWDAATLDRENIGAMAAQINAAGERLHHLIENFLVYAQIEVMQADQVRQTAMRDLHVNFPGEMIQGIAQSKAQQLGRVADLQVTVSDVPTLPIALENLQKIVEELVGNAFKFSEPGTVVQVVAHPGERHYQWSISNYGRGMTPEQIAHIGAGMQFERRLFEQQGAGLGLVIAKRLVELHGGKLLIESVPGVQTTMRVTLPLAE